MNKILKIKLSPGKKLGSKKAYFIIKESRPVRNATERIKQMLDAEYRKINLKSIIMNLNHFKNKHKNSLLELL